jgi:hypothetical protein
MLLSLSAAFAQNTGSRPAIHVGSFDSGLSIAHAVGTAEKAMRDAGLSVEHSNGLEVFGSSDHVEVVVTCASRGQGSRIVVLAASSDSGTAEFFRNNIRNRITNVHIIDGQ